MCGVAFVAKAEAEQRRAAAEEAARRAKTPENVVATQPLTSPNCVVLRVADIVKSCDKVNIVGCFVFVLLIRH